MLYYFSNRRVRGLAYLAAEWYTLVTLCLFSIYMVSLLLDAPLPALSLVYVYLVNVFLVCGTDGFTRDETVGTPFEIALILGGMLMKESFIFLT